MTTDAIVNAASTDLRPCEGICRAIYNATDTEKLLFADCYRHAFQKAYTYHCKSIAIHLMFSGDF